MRFALLLLMLTATICPGGTITDQFGPPYSTGDVIGTPSSFDIQKAVLSVSGGWTSVTVYFNYGGAATNHNGIVLNQFNDAGLDLIPGDVFFYDPTTVTDYSDPASAKPYLKYGVALTSLASDTGSEHHDSLVAGALYRIDGTNVGVATAQQALGNPAGVSYRPTAPALLTDPNLTAAPASMASDGVTVTSYGDGTTAARYAVTIGFETAANSTFQGLFHNGQIGLLFSSADCANDFIEGSVSSTPEPPSSALLLGGAILAAGMALKRLRFKHGGFSRRGQ